MSQDLTVVVPLELRDVRGVELDEALREHGARIIRELPRHAGSGTVELLVEDTNAPEHLRGRRVVPVWVETVPDGAEMILDRWEPAEPEPRTGVPPLFGSFSSAESAPCPLWSQEIEHTPHDWTAPTDGPSHCPGWVPEPAAL